MKKIWISDAVILSAAVISALLLCEDGWIACLMTIACVSAAHIVCVLFPRIISFGMYVFILLFIFMALVLGKMLNFYQLFPHLDFFLHLISGILLAGIGRKIFARTAVSPGEKLWLPFLFGSALAGLWEVYEFAGDLLFSLQSQGGSLTDTMTDIIAGNLGCLITAFVQQKKRLL